MTNQKLLTFLLMLSLSGCGAVQSQDGATLVVSNVPTKGLGLLAIALILIVLGIGIALESWKRSSAGSGRGRSKSGKGKKSRQQASGAGGIAGLIASIGLGGLGLFFLLLGVPSAFLASVRIEPDRIILRDDLLWFAGAQEIPFDQLADVSKEEYEVISRYRTRVEGSMYLRFQDGHQQTIKMADIHKLAYDPLVAALAEYQARGGTGVAESQAVPPVEPLQPDMSLANAPSVTPPFTPSEPPKAAANPGGSSSSADTSSLTPVDHLSYIFPGVEIRSQARNVVGRVLAVYQEGQILVRPNAGSSEPVLVPFNAINPGGMGSPPSGPGTGPGSELTPGASPPADSIVLAYYQGRWFEAKLISVAGNRCTIAYVGRERDLQGVGLSTVRIPGPEGTTPHINRRFQPPTDSLQPAGFAGSWTRGMSAFLITESEEPMTVEETYANGMLQLRDINGATHYAHWTELKRER